MTASILLPTPVALDSLVDIAQVLAAGDRGSLATDESMRKPRTVLPESACTTQVSVDALTAATTSGPARKPRTEPGEAPVLRAEGTA